MTEIKTLNKSFLYLFPLVYRDLVEELKLDYFEFHKLSVLAYLENTYCFVDENPDQLVLELTDSTKFIELVDIFKKSANFVNSFSLENPIIIFKISNKSQDSYNKFITGKYSKFNSEDKLSILKFVKYFLDNNISSSNDKNSLHNATFGVLYKTDEKIKEFKDKFGLSSHEFNKEWELSSIIDIEKETFNLYKYEQQ